MFIKKIHIENFKCIKNSDFELNEWLNIFVWDNWVWKTTVLEALDLALSWRYHWKYLWSELNQWLFNKATVENFINSLSGETKLPPPEIIIDLFIEWLEDPIKAEYEWNLNYLKRTACWIRFQIKIDESEISKIPSDITTLPIELYEYNWYTFSRTQITPRKFNKQLSSTFIDSSIFNYQSWWDATVFRAVKEAIDESEQMKISSNFRELQNGIGEHLSQINQEIKKLKFTEKEISIWMDYRWKNSWDNSLNIFIWGIPFSNCWKWEQCKIKTKIILSWEESEKSNILLIEEPESHLSYSELNKLINFINDNNHNKQILITTHSSFVANKLSLNNLILLTNNEELKQFKFSNLDSETYDFFLKLSWYDTIRFLLCPKVILAEWPSDDLIIQRAYKDNHNWKLPIEDWIDIITVWLSSPRFLKLIENLDKKVAIVTDNDWDYEKNIEERYKEFETYQNIKICASNDNEKNTLEPHLYWSNENNIEKFCRIMWWNDTDKNKILTRMKNNKTNYALSIFNSDEEIEYPDYILEAIKFFEDE